MKTDFFVEYDLFDTTALQDAHESASNNSGFSDISLIKDNVSAPNYGTLEHNLFVLDGSMEEFPDNPTDLVYFSSGLSDVNGILPSNQTITIRFSQRHTSFGLTLYFLESYPTELEILWYDIYDILQSKKTFRPNNLVYFCKNQVENYGRVVITFKKALPFHNVKLQYIQYGTKLVWGPDTITSGKLINDTDPISDKISTDKLTFAFVDYDDEFNVGNASGLHKTFQKKQRMLPYEVIDGEKIPLGVFFLESNSTTKNVSKISAVDYKGMLSNADFKEGRIYNGEPAGNIIDEIMSIAGIEEYQMDEETAKTPLYGTLKIQTCQKALREVLFACGSVINTSHRIGIDIFKEKRETSGRITRGKKFSTTFETDSYISDVNVKYGTWTLEEKVSELTKGIYGIGIHTIQFSSPAANIAASSGRILKRMPYYVVLSIDTETTSEIVISGQKYVSEELAASSSIEFIKSGEIRNAKTFTGTLLNFEAAKKAADRIIEYYQLQQIIKTKHLAGTEKAGDWVEIENPSGGRGSFLAVMESITTDLVNGFVATAKSRGYYKFVTDYYYADDELYADDIMGEII